MKRFHVHVGVRDLPASIRFYSALFAAPPTVTKPDYAKWMLDDPRINFAISERSGQHGVNHLGLQVDDDAELEEIHGRLDAAGAATVAERDVSCCYARSDKYWVEDPQGVPWESFRSLVTVPFHADGEAPAVAAMATHATANAPATATCCNPGPAKAADHAAKRCCG